MLALQTMSSPSSSQKLNAEIKEKVRILCLHGYRQNADAFKSKLGSFRKHVAKYAEFVFVDAPHTAPPLTEQDAVSTEQKSWWFNKDDGTFKGTNLGGPAQGFEQSLRTVESAWKKEGPFHGLLGFSQGACFVGLICGLAQKQMTLINPEFAIMSSGFISGSLVHKSAYEDAINIPSLHIYGLTDAIIPKEMSIALSTHFSCAEILEHSGGHYFPATSQQKQIYIDYFRDRLVDHLENKELNTATNALFIEPAPEEEDADEDSN